MEILLIALRFNNNIDRAEIIKKDRATDISGPFKTFIANSQNNFSFGIFVWVKESLISFSGRCGFIMYLKNMA